MSSILLFNISRCYHYSFPFSILLSSKHIYYWNSLYLFFFQLITYVQSICLLELVVDVSDMQNMFSLKSTHLPQWTASCCRETWRYWNSCYPYCSFHPLVVSRSIFWKSNWLWILHYFWFDRDILLLTIIFIYICHFWNSLDSFQLFRRYWTDSGYSMMISNHSIFRLPIQVGAFWEYESNFILLSIIIINSLDGEAIFSALIFSEECISTVFHFYIGFSISILLFN